MVGGPRVGTIKAVSAAKSSINLAGSKIMTTTNLA